MESNWEFEDRLIRRVLNSEQRKLENILQTAQNVKKNVPGFSIDSIIELTEFYLGDRNAE